jgi:ssDNA-binding Zn-finger/Zn-ribbon topoisomerase 1
MTQRRKRNHIRTGGKVLRGIGWLLGIVGAVGLIVAATLPWAQLTILQNNIPIPGVVAGVGVITAAIGLLILAQFGIWRRFPLLGVLLGIVAWAIGAWAQEQSGIRVRKFLLETQIKLSPINRRLMEIGLPPIEPTGSGIQSRRAYTGIGTVYTAWAGAGVTTASALLFIAEYMLRTCPHCRRVWSAKRGENIHFCPACGGDVTKDPICPHCAAPALHGEKFCVDCGEEFPQPGNKMKTTQVV